MLCVTEGSASMTASIRGSVDTVDVVVIGGGDAGLMASIEAADLGASVVLLQKNAELGGKSSWAIGSVTAGGTSLQAARGIQDTAEAHREDIIVWARKHGADSLPIAKLGLLIDNIAAAVERLIEFGVTFSGPHPEEMHGCYRMHVFSPHPMAVVSLLGLRARERGVHIRCDTPAEGLLTDGSGRVIGVRTRDRTVLARRAVVLASGDYSAARPNGEGPLGNEHAFRPWASGDGQFMAAEIGAETCGMDGPLRLDLRMVDWPHLRPEPFLFEHGAFIVTRSGKRVANELELNGLEIASKVDEDLFVVLDGALVDRLATAAEDSPHARDGWLRHDKLHLGTYPGVAYAYMRDVLDAAQAQHGSIPEIAAALDMNGDALEAEITAFGSAMRGETPDPFGRPANGRGPDGGPYLVLGPGRYRCFNGQAAVNCDLWMRALRPDGNPVPGLFVAGNSAARANVGYALGGHGYGLGWALVSGRIAGTEAARHAVATAAVR
jgi:succinate dehydrogenase/fumarate reductase flavoprotein subunit